jgi:hypothetical protein
MKQLNAVPPLTPETTIDPVAGLSVHGAFWPDELRLGEKALVLVTFPNISPEATEMRLWSISPLGAEIVGEGLKRMPTPGERADITIVLPKQKLVFNALHVAYSQTRVGLPLFAIRWCAPEETLRTNAEDERKQKRWICGQMFRPTAVAPCPVKFDDMLVFRVADISKSGARFHTSMRNKYVIPGMKFSAVLTFPALGSVQTEFVVRWTNLDEEDGRQVLTLGVEFTRSSGELEALCGEYLLQFGQAASVGDLKQAGFNVR